MMTQKLTAAIAAILANPAYLAATVVSAVVGLAVYTLARWKTFRKAGKAGWKSLVPYINTFVDYDICWDGKPATYTLLSADIIYLISWLLERKKTADLAKGGAAASLMTTGVLGDLMQFLESLLPWFLALLLILFVVKSFKLAKAFDRSPLFAVGLILLPLVFRLILAFDKSEYVGKYGSADREAIQQKRHMGLKASNAISNTVIHILLVVISVIWLIPFVCIVLQSFRTELATDPVTGEVILNSLTGMPERVTGMVGYVLPKKWGFDNYIDLWHTNFPKWYLNTFIIALVVAVVQTVIVLCMSYTLSRFRFKMRKGLMQFMLILGMFPGMLAMIILYRVLDDLHLTGQYGHAVPGLILVYCASSGMGYYVSKGFFDTIPKSLDEAARVDGANRAQVLYKIILPLAKPIVIYTVLTAFMGPWGDFVFARYVSQMYPQAMNVAVGLQSWLATTTMIHDNYTLFCAGGVVVAIPVAILFMCLQRYYVEGVTGGAVKG